MWFRVFGRALQSHSFVPRLDRGSPASGRALLLMETPGQAGGQLFVDFAATIPVILHKMRSVADAGPNRKHHTQLIGPASADVVLVRDDKIL